MAFKSLFFYDDGANEGAGGAASEGANAVSEQNQEQQQQATHELPADVVAQLKELEELRVWKAANTKEPEKSAEEIAKENELEKVNLKKFAVENNIAVDDDFVKYETLQQRKDADLVFENFLSDFKEENENITDEEELREAAEEEFNKTYKLTSENAKAKEKGLARLAKEANEIRTPFKSKVESATTAYSEEKQLRAKMPEFNKFIETQIAKNAPDKIPFTIKVGKDKNVEDITVEIDLTEDDRKAISKDFNTPKTFLKYSKSPEEAEKALEKKIQSWVKANKFEEAAAKAITIGEGRGIAKSSNVGAEAPFAMKQGQGRNEGKTFTLQESNDKMARARANFN